MGITTTVILWFMIAKDSPHDISNAKQMSNQTENYWGNGHIQNLHSSSKTASTCIAILDKLDFL